MTKIITDSASNISQTEAKEMGLSVLPFPIIIDDEEYLDDINLTIDEFYTKLTTCKDFPKTSQLSPETLENEFEKSKQNNEDILLILLSSQLSGTYNTANMIKNNGEYNNVYIYDTKGASVLNKILVDTALKHKDKHPAEIIKILDNVRSKINIFALLETLEYLVKGGRLSKTSGTIGTILNIKPIVTINDMGSIEVKTKAVGFNNGLKTIVNIVEKEGEIDTDYPVYFLYSQNKLNGEKLANKFNVTEPKLINLCSVIGSHIGPGIAGIAYVKK